MKKLLAIIVLGLLLSSNTYAESVNLECGDQSNYNQMLYVKANKRTLEVYQPSSGNRIKFKVLEMNEYKITTQGRGLDKATTSYDTHLTNWDLWDDSKFIKDYLYKIGIERVQGYVGVGRSIEPWTGKKKYKYEILWEVPCKKFNKKF